MTEKYASQDSSRYHTRLDCKYVKNPDRFYSRSSNYIESKNLEPCSWCAEDGMPDNGGGSRDLYEKVKAMGESNTG